MPRPGPSGARPIPPLERGWWPAAFSTVQSFMKETVKSAPGSVLAARCATAAVTMSPPHESSIVSRRPSVCARREAADLRDLQVDRLHRLRLVGSEERLHVADRLVEHHRQRRPLAHDQALLERGARLLEEHPRKPVERARRKHGVLQPPAAVGVGDDQAIVARVLDDERGARGVLQRVGAELQLEAAHAVGASREDVLGHRLARPERHREVEGQLLGRAPAEQLAHRQAEGTAERVPARDVDGALRVPVAHQGPVERRADGGEVRRVDTEHGGPELPERSKRAAAVRRQVRRPERAHLAEALDAVLGANADDRRREPLDHPPSRHHVAAVRVRQLVREDIDAPDRGAQVATLPWRLGRI
jgi:hypothetical protein